MTVRGRACCPAWLADRALAGGCAGSLGSTAGCRFGPRWRRVLAGRTIWTVNSTAAGGGVAEMLQVLVGYVQDLDIPIGWLVITGDAGFFAITSGCTIRSTAACPEPRSERRMPVITNRCSPRTRWSWLSGSGPAMWCCCTTRNTAALADALLRVSRLADDLPEVSELDLNPVVARPDGVRCVDVRVRISPAEPREPFLRRPL